MLGAGEEYVGYRTSQYGEAGEGEKKVINIMVVRGEVVIGPGMLDGTFQGSCHSTKDLLVAGEFTLRATRAELQRRSLKFRFSCFADDWLLQDVTGVQCIIVLHEKLDAAVTMFGSRANRSKLAILAPREDLSEEHHRQLRQVGFRDTRYTRRRRCWM